MIFVYIGVIGGGLALFWWEHKSYQRRLEADRKRRAALFGCDHPNFDGTGVCTLCKEFYSAAHDRGEAPSEQYLRPDGR